MNLFYEIKKLEYQINKKMRNNKVTVNIMQLDTYKGAIVLYKKRKIDKCFEFEIISCCQINIIENGKVIEIEILTDQLGPWIFNLYNPVEFSYEFYGGELSHKVLTIEKIRDISNGMTDDLSKERENGALVHRKELDNQPMVKGYLGPMFEKIDYGKVYLRYETQEIYDMLSA